jgi:hypothetical protein
MAWTTESDVYRRLADEAPVDADARSALLRIAKILDTDPRQHIQFLAQHAYYFLTQTLSPAQSIFVRHLGAFRGDVLRETYYHALSSSPQYAPDYDQQFYGYLREQIVRLARTSRSEVVNSAQLACALTLFNLTPLTSSYQSKTLRDVERGVRFEYRKGNEFWHDHGLSEDQLVSLAFDLARYDGSEVLEPHDISERFRLCISADPDGLAVFPTERWGLHSVARGDGTTAVRELVLPEAALVLPDQLEEFAELLEATRVNEADWQRFLDRNPVFLYLLGDYEAHRREVALVPQMSFDETPELGLRPDFILKRAGLNLWDILEAKLPKVDIVVGHVSRRHLSSTVVSALSQIRLYAEYFRDRGNFQWFHRTYGAGIATPRLHLLVGRDSSFRDAREKSKFAEAEGVHIFTYDDLFRIAKHRSIRTET